MTPLAKVQALYHYSKFLWAARRTRKGLSDDDRDYGRPEGALYQLMTLWFRSVLGVEMPRVMTGQPDTQMVAHENSWGGMMACMLQWDARLRDSELVMFRQMTQKLIPMGKMIQDDVEKEAEK